MRYLRLHEVLELHRQILVVTGGRPGVRDLSGLASAVAQPLMTFDGVALYETLAEKAAALCFSLVMNHPFVDGNKRIGHAAMETFLIMNGFEIAADIDESEQVFLRLAAGEMSREELLSWIRFHMIQAAQ